MGSQLCQALVKAYEAVGSRPLDQHHVVKTSVVNALKSLLATSFSAKAAALEGNIPLLLAIISYINKYMLLPVYS